MSMYATEFEYIQEPWFDDGQWNMSLYSTDYEHGTPVYYRGDRDGNWDLCDEIPDQGEIDKAHYTYFAWVAEHGQDPLNIVLGVRKVKAETWMYDVQSLIDGTAITRARNTVCGAWLAGADIPDYALKFYEPVITLVEDRYYFSKKHGWNISSLRRTLDPHTRGAVPWVWFTKNEPGHFVFKMRLYDIPRAESAIVRDMKKQARRILREW